MYRFSTAAICIVLLVMMLGGVEFGPWVGRRRRPRSDDSARSQTNAIQADILGLFALPLGFTFTMAVQRYDARNRAVTVEANAIGTAFLRSKLLPPPDRDQAATAIRRYVDTPVVVRSMHADTAAASAQG